MPNDPPAPALGAQQRGPLRQPDPEQYCARCGERLVRRRYPSGRSEWPGAFRARKYCSSACVGLAQRGSTNRRIAELEAAIRAQAARLAELEPCYEDARSTAARLLIEQEQYAQTVRNLTERAEFASQRADAQAARLAAVEPILAAARRMTETQRGYEQGKLFWPEWESRQRTAIGQIVAAVTAAGVVGAGEPHGA